MRTDVNTSLMFKPNNNTLEDHFNVIKDNLNETAVITCYYTQKGITTKRKQLISTSLIELLMTCSLTSDSIKIEAVKLNLYDKADEEQRISTWGTAIVHEYSGEIPIDLKGNKEAIVAELRKGAANKDITDYPSYVVKTIKRLVQPEYTDHFSWSYPLGACAIIVAIIAVFCARTAKPMEMINKSINTTVISITNRLQTKSRHSEENQMSDQEDCSTLESPQQETGSSKI